MTATRSAVVQTLEQASLDAWKKWRDHVLAGTSDSAEALEAFADSKLASDALLGEIMARFKAEHRIGRVA